MYRAQANGQRQMAWLAVGDVIALVAWVVVGLESHHMSSNWLMSILRVVAPFIIGWFVVAPLVGAYRPTLFNQPGPFMRHSALAWLGSVCLGLLLRATVFGSGFVPTFALVTFIVTAVFVLGWRAAWIFFRRRQQQHISQTS